MDRQAFKQRMQNLKSYREQNPGKGYWDFKAYQPGGETGNDDKELKRSLNIAAYILKHRKSLTDDSDVINDYSSNILWTMENPTNRGLKDGLYYPYTDKGVDGVTRKNIGPGFESHSNIAKQLKYDESTGYSKDFLTGLASEDLRKATPKIVESINRMNNGEYYGVWDTLSTGPKMIIYDIYHNVKHNNKKNLPEKWPGLIKALAEGDLEEAKKQTYSGSTRRQKMRNQLATYGNVDSVTNHADGGETGDDEPIRTGTTQYDVYGNTTHYLPVSLSNDTLSIGLPDIPVIVKDNLNLAAAVQAGQDQLAGIGKEVFANLTPYGDLESAVQAYDAAKNKDWLGLSLAGLGMLPLVPNIARYAKSSYRYIPTVNRSNVQSQIDAILARQAQNLDYLTDVANEKNRVLESLRTVPFQNRARKADEIYGTDYQRTYDTVNNLYENDFFKLPEVTAKDMESRGRMQAKPAAVKKFNETGEGAGPEDFELQVNPKYPLDPEQMSTHELNHYIDFIISRNADASKNNKMLRELEKDLKKTDDYFSKGTEQKSYMNQLRVKLKQDGIIQDLDEPVSAPVLKKYLDNMSDKDPIKRAFDQHKSIKSYTKWFNTIPLAGVSPLMLNNKDRNERVV